MGFVGFATQRQKPWVVGGNQKHLADQIAAEMNLSVRQGRAFVSRMLELIQVDLVEHGRCELRGLGTFAVFERPERQTTHPVTGQPVVIPARRGVRYRSSKKLKELLNPEPPKPQKAKKRPLGAPKQR